jgi:hypothetical protein
MMRGSEVRDMSDAERKIDELASDLDDLTTTVEELEMDTSDPQKAGDLRRLQRALEHASDAADAVDDSIDEAG